MKVYKILFHISALLKYVFFKLIYVKRFNMGKKVTWRRRFNVMIDKKAIITIGNNCFFNNDCSLNALNRITIGDNSIFGENVKVYDHNHRFGQSGIPLKQQGYSIGEVHIGKNCWIGSNAVILKGADIGDNCVIGAGVVVSSKVEPGTIVKNESKIITEMIRPYKAENI